MPAEIIADDADRTEVFVSAFDYNNPQKKVVVPLSNLNGKGAVRTGEVTLVAGVATITDPLITANSRIFLQRRTIGGTAGNLGFTRSVGASWSITNSSATDTSTVNYMVIG